ncbi:SusC/RagA family TonB-linked outer membrane protein [Maribellus comscasis]|nr:TonB-dependent receptor [Maribellus comscasis]
MKNLMVFVFGLLLCTTVWAQQRTITGMVSDEVGQPLPGVNVTVEGTAVGTVTGPDGSFTLQINENITSLLVSFIGFKTQEVDIASTSNISVQMELDAIGIEEVVAVGYGIQKKVNLTGSIASVQGEKLAEKSVVQTSQALQGIAAGVTVTSNNGKPGNEGTTVRVRGIGTLNDNNPLVLIDGVASSLDAIDPNDIADMSILKDAASAAIYGSRAANGVILITTKRGKSGEMVVSYNGSVGFTTPITYPVNASAWDYMMLYDEANANDLRTDDGVPGGVIYGTEKINTWKNATDRDEYPNSDMFKETYADKAAQTKHFLSLSMGTDKLKSNTSINYTYQDAHYPNSGYTRYGVRSNNSYKMNDVVEFGVDLSIRKTLSEDAAAGITDASGQGHNLDQLMRQPAIYPTRFSNGVWGYNYNGGPHAMMSIFEALHMTYNTWHETLAKLSATINPFTGMRINLSYAPKLNTADIKTVSKTTNLYDYQTGEVIYTPPGQASMTETRNTTIEDDINVLVNYDKSIGGHDLSALGGFQYLTNDYNHLYAYRQGNDFQQFEELNSYNPVGQTNSGYTTEWALMSYFGRINYSYNGKYLLEANVRYDGSSRFASGYKWGVFPSFSLGWRFSEESFMDNLDWLDNAKLRASWGELGNQSGLGSNYPFALTIATDQYAVFGDELNPGYAPVNYALNDITWETTRMLDFGIDFTILGGKLDATFDWYKKDTRDILLSMPIPSVMGYANSPKQNAGAVENIGWDLTLSHANTFGKFYYKITGILSDVKNKITDMGGLNPQVSGIYVKQVGDPINALYGYQADGLFSSFEEARAYEVTQWGKLQGGDIRYIDLDDDGAMTGDDRFVLGNPIPRWTYSLNLDAKYEGFDLALFFQGVGKRDGYISGWYAYPFSNASTVLEQHLDRWYEGNPNPDAAFPRLSINQHSNNTQPSTFWQVSAAYLRLKNVQLGYTLPASLLKGKSISNVRIFANASNVFTISDLPIGMDPESPFSVQGSYPLISTYAFGVQVKF